MSGTVTVQQTGVIGLSDSNNNNPIYTAPSTGGGSTSIDYYETVLPPNVNANAGSGHGSIVTGNESGDGLQKLRSRSRSMSTNTPPLVYRLSRSDGQGGRTPRTEVVTADGYKPNDIELMERQLPIKPPRKKASRSTSPSSSNYQAITFARTSQSGPNEDRSAVSEVYSVK